MNWKPNAKTNKTSTNTTWNPLKNLVLSCQISTKIRRAFWLSWRGQTLRRAGLRGHTPRQPSPLLCWTWSTQSWEDWNWRDATCSFHRAFKVKINVAESIGSKKTTNPYASSSTAGKQLLLWSGNRTLYFDLTSSRLGLSVWKCAKRLEKNEGYSAVEY